MKTSKMFVLFVWICGVICVSWVGADVAMLGVGAGRKGGMDLTGSSFSFANTEGQLTRLAGEGLQLSLNQLQIYTSRGLLNMTSQGYEFRRGKNVWNFMNYEDRIEYKKNEQILLSISANERVGKNQFIFAGQGIFSDVVFDKSELFKAHVLLCTADRALGNQLHKPTEALCKDVANTYYSSFSNEMELIGKILVGLLDVSVTTNERVQNQAKQIDKVLLEKLEPVLSRVNDAISKQSMDQVHHKLTEMSQSHILLQQTTETAIAKVQHGLAEKLALVADSFAAKHVASIAELNTTFSRMLSSSVETQATERIAMSTTLAAVNVSLWTQAKQLNASVGLQLETLQADHQKHRGIVDQALNNLHVYSKNISDRVDQEAALRREDVAAQAAQREQQRQEVAAALKAFQLEQAVTLHAAQTQLQELKDKDLAVLRDVDEKLRDKIAAAEGRLSVHHVELDHLKVSADKLAKDVGASSEVAQSVEKRTVAMEAHFEVHRNTLNHLVHKVDNATETTLPKLKEEVSSLLKSREELATSTSVLKKGFEVLRDFAVEAKLNASHAQHALHTEVAERTTQVQELQKVWKESTEALKTAMDAKHVEVGKALSAVHGAVQDSAASIKYLSEVSAAHTDALQQINTDVQTSKQATLELKALQQVVSQLAERLAVQEREGHAWREKAKVDFAAQDKENKRLHDLLQEHKQDLHTLQAENVQLKLSLVDKESFRGLQTELRETQQSILQQATNLFKIVTENFLALKA